MFDRFTSNEVSVTHEDLERHLEGMERRATAAAAVVWMAQVWPEECERDQVRDRVWRAFRAWSEDAGEAYGWVSRAVEAAREASWRVGHDLTLPAQGCVGAGLMWAWWLGHVHGVRWERVTLEVVDGVEEPLRFVAAPLDRKGVNDMATVRFDLAAGRFGCEAVAAHEPGKWVARGTAAPARIGGGFVTWSGTSLPAR